MQSHDFLSIVLMMILTEGGKQRQGPDSWPGARGPRGEQEESKVLTHGLVPSANSHWVVAKWYQSDQDSPSSPQVAHKMP